MHTDRTAGKARCSHSLQTRQRESSESFEVTVRMTRERMLRFKSVGRREKSEGVSAWGTESERRGLDRGKQRVRERCRAWYGNKSIDKEEEKGMDGERG